ncbi:MAG: Flp pilus assembly complex ATPase component TadA, partial [Phycisphaerales bacterium]|nr:Flp pilus assembly complex ATPase component TadA [Phycisphaerales bacterium]
YSALKRLARPEINICTIEDPIELVDPSLNQMYVQPQIGLDFATGVRTLLRQDPDIIMVGEIRDSETADTAIQAALTGHLVFSTLHTNDAAGSITRLLDMGVEPFLVTSAVEGVLAQRLLRTVCPDCRTDDHPEPGAIPPDFPGGERAFAVGAGCRECRNTGYRGRLGIYELLVMTDPLREMVVQRRSARDIAQTAIENDGMRTLRAAGFDKVAQGATTIPEVIRVTKI